MSTAIKFRTVREIPFARHNRVEYRTLLFRSDRRRFPDFAQHFAAGYQLRQRLRFTQGAIDVEAPVKDHIGEGARVSVGHRSHVLLLALPRVSIGQLIGKSSHQSLVRRGVNVNLLSGK